MIFFDRYDHFAALCELLPTSLPCLGVCLLILEEKSYSPTTVARVDADLGYTNEITTLVRSSDVPYNFNFLGWEVLKGISKFVNLRQSLNMALGCEQ